MTSRAVAGCIAVWAVACVIRIHCLVFLGPWLRTRRIVLLVLGMSFNHVFGCYGTSGESSFCNYCFAHIVDVETYKSRTTNIFKAMKVDGNVLLKLSKQALST